MSASNFRSWVSFLALSGGTLFFAFGCAPLGAPNSPKAETRKTETKSAMDFSPMHEGDFASTVEKSPTSTDLGVIGGMPSDGVLGGGVTAAKSAPSRANQSQAVGEGAAAPQGAAAAQRKLIQNYQLEVAVKNLDDAETALRGLIESVGGFISQSDRGSQPGQRRQGRWTVRVPGNKAGDMAAQVMGLGEPMRQSSKSQDVTEEYFDLEARLKNKRVEEERLIKHLRDSTGKLEEILLVEKEIARVRGEIEQSQGRLNMLANLTSLATLQVLLAEHVDYKPEAAPTFVTRIQRTFGQSFGGLTEFLESLTLFLVALIPWIPVILVACIPAAIVIRRAWKTVPAAPAAEITK